jgi:hypothetical protein
MSCSDFFKSLRKIDFWIFTNDHTAIWPKFPPQQRWTSLQTPPACQPATLYAACLTVDQAISSQWACTHWRCSPRPLQCAYKSPEDNSTLCSARDEVTSWLLGPMFDVRWVCRFPPGTGFRMRDLVFLCFSHVLKVGIESIHLWLIYDTFVLFRIQGHLDDQLKRADEQRGCS